MYTFFKPNLNLQWQRISKIPTIQTLVKRAMHETSLSHPAEKEAPVVAAVKVVVAKAEMTAEKEPAAAKVEVVEAAVNLLFHRYHRSCHFGDQLCHCFIMNMSFAQSEFFSGLQACAYRNNL